jgi:glycosyltransferase involved in cell wall biosynthesis
LSSIPIHISAIIPTYNRPGFLRRCIASLASQAYPREKFEIIIVDDGSDPPVTTSLYGFNSDLNIIHIQQPHNGVAAARTTGIAHARGAILAFLDHDCTVPPDYLAAIDRVFQKYPETQLVRANIENPEPDNVYGRLWKFTLEERLKVNLHPTQDKRFTNTMAGGMGTVARREVFTVVAFDLTPRIREDTDLSYQLQAHGIPGFYEAGIRVFHHQRQTLRAFLAQAFGYGRGTFHLLRKWGAAPTSAPHGIRPSWRAFRLFLKAEGFWMGLIIYSVFWLRGHANLWGLLHEGATWEFSGRPVLRWARFGWLLLAAYSYLLFRVITNQKSAGPASMHLMKFLNLKI